MSYIDLLITGILAFIMLSVGLSLNWQNFAETFIRPKAFILGLVLQIVFLPILAFLIVWPSSIAIEFKVGIIILAACPGGMIANFIAYLFNASVALAISLTVVNSFIALLSIPFVVNLALGFFLGTEANIYLPFWDTVKQIFLITILPVFAGMLIKKYNEALTIRLEKALKWITVVLLGILFAIKFFAPTSQGGTGITLTEIWAVLPFSLLVNIASLFSGYFFARLFGLRADDQLTIGINVGIQNTSLAFLIAGVFIGNEEMIKPALVYAMFTFFTAVLYSIFVKPDELQNALNSFRGNS